MQKITYIYQAGRTARMSDMENSAKEFFYGYFHMKKAYPDTNHLEFDSKNNISITKLFNNFIRKLSGLPFFSDLIINSKNKKVLKNSKKIIATNQRVGFSILSFLIFNHKKKIKSYVFIMGLFNNNPKNRIKKFFRIFFIKVFMATFNHMIFLSSGEFKFVSEKYPKYKEKIHFLPFSVDQEFWVSNNRPYKKKNNILFIGNDGKRDYKFAIDLAKELSFLNFDFITKKITNSEIKSDNVNLLSGKWDDMNISDSDIRDYYQEADLSIIPIFNSLQPSGQSVALQSMSMGIPVLITKTDGFWEPELYKNNENIIFVEKNDINLWKENILSLLENNDLNVKVSKNAKDLVSKNNNLNIFNRKLKEIIDS
tara:strand:+ start:532 stop:1635 length:1104 start_codon:yes stop_codon:yes gene_type:complete